MARRLVVILLSALCALPHRGADIRSRPVLIAHRGASAYAPEHTLEAYALAIRQGADYVEQDLQLTKDGVLICSHDAELSRTTNVAAVYPHAATLRDVEKTGIPKRGWYVVDLTLAEIKRLDAGSWFNRANPFAASKNYAGLKVPTLEEAMTLIGARARLYLEMKHVPFYESMGEDMVGALVSFLKSRGQPSVRKSARTGSADLPGLFIQAFSKASLLRLREIAPQYSRVQLLPMEDPDRGIDTRLVTERLAREIAEYAHGVGPAKEMLRSASDVSVFHRSGLKVHPYTFRGSTTASRREPLTKLEANGKSLQQNIVDEIRDLVEFDIDGGFTDYPDLWNEAVAGNRRSVPNSQP
jgi:glycerophosphoryl diester phosphodiesterase